MTTKPNTTITSNTTTTNIATTLELTVAASLLVEFGYYNHHNWASDIPVTYNDRLSQALTDLRDSRNATVLVVTTPTSVELLIRMGCFSNIIVFTKTLTAPWTHKNYELTEESYQC